MLSLVTETPVQTVTRAAIRRATKSANVAWFNYMLNAVYEIALGKESFTTDDVRNMFDNDTSSTRPETSSASSIGPVMLEAQSKGWISYTEGSVKRSTRPSSHGRFITLWNSTIYKAAA